MKKYAVVCLSLAALIALPSSASAATKQLSGTVKDSEGKKIGSITVKVLEKNGVPKRVTGIRVRAVRSTCLSEDGVSQGPKVTANLKANLKVQKRRTNGKTFYTFAKMNVRGGGYGWFVGGNFAKGKAKKINEGILQSSDIKPAPPESRCSINGNYTAK